MSSFVSIQVRNTQGIKPYAFPVTMQIDNMGLIEAAAMGGAVANYPFDAYVFGVPLATDGNYLIQQGDMLIDQNVQPFDYDTKTASGKAEWRVAGIPEPFEASHVELKVIRYREKTVYHG
jgi:hypothetical protein